MNKYSLAAVLILVTGIGWSAEQNMDHIGFLGLHTVVYNIQPIGSHQYQVEAHTSNDAPEDELLRVYKARIARLCGGHWQSLYYKRDHETYTGTYNGKLFLPLTAPTVKGVVRCK